MKALEAVLNLLSRATVLGALLVVFGAISAPAQQVIGYSEILSSTNSTHIDTWSETDMDANTAYYYDAYVEGYLFQNNSLVIDGYAQGNPYAGGGFTEPLTVGDTYEIDSYHYLIQYFSYQDAYGNYYYDNPYYYLADGGGDGFDPNGYGYTDGGGPLYYENYQYLFLGATYVVLPTGVPNITSYNPTDGSVETSGTLTLGGTNLEDLFTQSTTPAITGSGMTLTIQQVTPTQVTLNYTIAENASPGGHNITVATRFGTSNAVSFNVGDPTPVVKNVNPGTWNASASTPVTISGTGFGTKPTVTLSGTGVTFTPGTVGDTQITGTVTVTNCAPAQTITVTVQNNGYYGNGFVGTTSGQSQDGTNTATVQPIAPPSISLSRQSLTQIQAKGSPSGGSFSYSVASLSGTSLAKISFASGVTSTTNPNTTDLGDPSNPNANGSPSPGGLAQIKATYNSCSTAAPDPFQVPTFGMSCYYTTLQSDWGVAPSSCKSVTIKGVVYSGTITNPYGLTGTYCSSFIAEVKLQGSGVLTGGQDIQYSPTANKITKVSVINGADGSAVVANQTVARDRSIIPTGGVHVDINQIGTNLLANDTGGDILGYRIDLYRGAGKAVCTSYNNIISVSACSPGNSKCPASAVQ